MSFENPFTAKIPPRFTTPLNFTGTWNASTNTPTLTSSVGTKGSIYIVAVSGTTNLNGISDWEAGDWAVFDGAVWGKVDNSSSDALLRANNLSDLTNPAAAVTALGATAASTPSTLMLRNASGVVNVSTLTVDGASGPAVNIGGVNTLSMGTATGNNQFFTGTVAGDTCIRSSNTSRQLLLGVGSGNAQFAVLNTVVQSNVTHRFGYAGTNRMPYLDASSNLTGSANYTVNGTGGLTITQTLTAGGGSFSGNVTITATNQSLNLGSAQQVTLAKASSAAAFFSGTVANDGVLRLDNTSNTLHIGVGSSNAQLLISNTQVAVNGAFSCSGTLTGGAGANFPLGTVNAFTLTAGSGSFTGNVTSGGLILPTTGGTPATLSYYETGTFTASMATPDGTNRDLVFTVTRIGNKVTLSWPTLSVTASVATAFAAAAAIPARWRSAVSKAFSVIVGDNNVQIFGSLSIDTSGNIVFFAGASSQNFQATGLASIVSSSVSYLTT